MRGYLYHLAIALDQLLNATLGGYADETLSSRAYRRAVLNAKPKRRWRLAHRLIDGLFWWQNNHCRGSYEREHMRWHLPPDLR